MGGCEINVQISNVCTISRYDGYWYVDDPCPDVISTTSDSMTYNSDNKSYSYPFLINKAGPISIFIYAYDTGSINAIF